MQNLRIILKIFLSRFLCWRYPWSIPGPAGSTLVLLRVGPSGGIQFIPPSDVRPNPAGKNCALLTRRAGKGKIWRNITRNSYYFWSYIYRASRNIGVGPCLIDRVGGSSAEFFFPCIATHRILCLLYTSDAADE